MKNNEHMKTQTTLKTYRPKRVIDRKTLRRIIQRVITLKNSNNQT